MYYIIYKTTNNINGMYYIGCHQTNSIDDGYLGSGKYLRRAISAYGVENFTRQILFECSTAGEMFSKETEIVNKDVVRDPQSYNLKIGGSGGNPGIVGAFKGRKHTLESKNKIREKALLQITSSSKRQKSSMNNWSRTCPDRQKEHARKNGLLSKAESHRNKISESLMGRQQGIVQCPHCNRMGGNRLMKRWHFDKCKYGLVVPIGRTAVSKTV